VEICESSLSGEHRCGNPALNRTYKRHGFNIIVKRERLRPAAAGIHDFFIYQQAPLFTSRLSAPTIAVVFPDTQRSKKPNTDSPS
jgi:hypothetical protein